MSSFNDFEEIEAWKKARVLLKEVYKVIKRPCFFNDGTMQGQFSGAALSVMNNIAEGKDRDGNKEFIQFLSIARGSAGEVRSMLYAAIDQEYINREEFNYMRGLTVEISKMIKALMKYLKDSGRKGFKFKE